MPSPRSVRRAGEGARAIRRLPCGQPKARAMRRLPCGQPKAQRKNEIHQSACKPGSVWRFPSATVIRLGRPLLDASSNQPGRRPGRRPVRRRLPGSARATPIWSCSRWGLQCRDRYRPRGALLPHPFTLTWRSLERVHEVAVGGLLSVALSLGSPPAAVSRHRSSMEPGLSSTRTGRLLRRVRDAQRPSGRLVVYIRGCWRLASRAPHVRRVPYSRLSRPSTDR